MLTAFVVFIKIYAFLFSLGLGVSCWLSKSQKSPLAFIWASAPLIGFSLIAITSVYPLSQPTDVHWIHYLATLLTFFSLLTTVAYLYYQRRQLTFTSWHFSSVPFWLLATLGFICFNLANFQNGFFYHYLNPDIAGFTSSANWIAHYGNLATNEVAAHEVLTAALRWGIPSVLAVTQVILHIPVYAEIFFIVLIVFSHCIALMTLLMIETYHHRPPKLTQIIIIAILLNGSLLYFLSESFYPYIIGVGYFCAFAALSQGRSNHFTTFILAILCLATLITTCSELFCLSLALTFGLLCINALRRNSIRTGLYFLLAICLSFALTFPLSHQIIHFTLANTANSGHVGYPQPAWVWPSDILGLTNIYSNSKVFLNGIGDKHIFPHTIFYHVLRIILSLWVIFELSKWRRNSLFLTLVIGTLAILALNIYLIHYTQCPPYNYLYDKLAIAFAPLFIAFFFIGLAQKSIVTIPKIFIAFALSLISSLLFFHDRPLFKSKIDITALTQIANQFATSSVMFIDDARGFRSDKTLWPWRYIDRTSAIIMTTLLNDKIIDSWDLSSWDPYPNTDEILFIANKAHFPNEANFLLIHSRKLLFTTRSYYVFSTHKTLADLKQGNREQNIKKLYAQFNETYS